MNLSQAGKAGGGKGGEGFNGIASSAESDSEKRGLKIFLVRLVQESLRTSRKAQLLSQLLYGRLSVKRDNMVTLG